MFNIMVYYKINEFAKYSENSVINVETFKGSFLYPQDKEKIKTKTIDAMERKTEIKAYCFVFNYDKNCADRLLGTPPLSKDSFKNKEAQDISITCLDNPDHYDNYKDCNNFLVGLFSENYIDHAD